MKVREGLWHIDPKPLNILGIEKTGGLYDDFGAIGIGLRRVERRNTREGADQGHHNQEDDEIEENEDGVRQLVSCPLDPAKETLLWCLQILFYLLTRYLFLHSLYQKEHLVLNYLN